MERAIRATSDAGTGSPTADPRGPVLPEQGDDQAQAQPLSADIFISYSRKDIAFARLIRASLQASGLDTWIDWDRIPVGERWWDEICQAIERTHIFMFIISASSMSSPVCRDEINQALKNHKRIIPILVDHLAPEAVHRFVPELPELNWVIFEKDHLFQIAENEQAQSGPPEDRLVALPKQPQFEQAMARLSEAIHTDWDWVRSHTQLQVDALRWSTKDRDASYLLRGSALEDAEGWLSRAGGHDPQPTLLQSQFITASRIEETRRQRENSRRQRRLLWAIGGALVVTAALGGVALIQRNEADYQRSQAQLQQAEAQTQRDAAQAQRDEAQRQATAALSGELAAESANNLGARFDVGMLLAAESWSTLDSYTSRNALLAALGLQPRLKSVMWTQHQLSDVAYSPDGKLLAGAYCAESDPISHGCFDYEVGTWSTADGRPVGTSLPEQRGPLVFTRDGDLITVNARRQFLEWNLASHQIRGPVFAGLKRYPSSLVLSPSGTMLAAGACAEISALCTGAQVVVWDVATRRVLYDTVEANVVGPSSLAFSPDGSTLAVGGCSATGTNTLGNRICLHGSVGTWDAASGGRIEHAVEGAIGIAGVAFSPDGTTLAVEDGAGLVQLLDLGSWNRTASWQGSPGFNAALTFGHDGSTLAVTSSGQGPGQLLDGHDAHEIGKLSAGIMSAANLDPLGNTVAEASCYQSDHSGWSCEQGMVQLWDIGLAQPPGRAFVRTASSVGTTSLSRNGTRLALATCVRREQVNELNDRCVDGRVDVFDSATGEPWGKPLVGLTSDVSLVAFDSAGDRLVTISCSSWETVRIQTCLTTQIDVWDLAGGTRLRPTLVSSQSYSTLILLAADGRTLILGAGSDIERWDLVTGQKATEAIPGLAPDSSLEALAFSPDGGSLVAASCTKRLNFQSLECQTSEIRSWDTTTWTSSGEPIVLNADLTKTIGMNVGDLQFTPDGSKLMIATTEGIRFWDLAGRRLSDVVIPSTGVVVALSHSGKLLAIYELGGNGSGAQVALWDVTLLQQVGPTLADVWSRDTTRLAFSEDDSTLFSSSGMAWTMEPAAWKGAVCSIAGRDLTPAEWTKFVGTAPYHATCGFPTGPTEPAPAPTDPPTASPFSPTGALATSRAGHTATLLLDGRVLIAGGRVGALDSIASAELYDPQTGTFTPTGSMTTSRWGHTATLLSDGRVLIAGCKSQAPAELYDPTTATFHATGSMAVARCSHTATLLSDGRVLVAGGLGQGADTTAEVYDPRTGGFTPTGSMTASRHDHTATLLSDGRVLITGGTGTTAGGTTSKVHSSAEIYDPRTGKFSPTGSMATARQFDTATLLPDGRVLVVGGEDALNMPLDSAELYDPKTGTFSPTGSMSDTWEGHTATLLPDGRVLVAGGLQNSMIVPVASAVLYDPETGLFTTGGSMAAGRQGHTATLLADGRVLIAGGSSKGSVIGSAEVFKP
jgi:WD40 repeat protein